MKGVFVCPFCMKENPLIAIFEDYYNDEDISEYQCPNCKENFLVTSRNDKYRILFDYAIISLQDGYCNNAILNAYSALEEFMKRFIEFTLYKSNVEIENIINFIQSISLAENKKGAFLLSYFQQFNIIITKNKWEKFTKIRNEVIHNGKLSNENEAYKYCKIIYDFINDTLLKISKKYNEEDYVYMDLDFQKYYNEKNNPSLDVTAGELPSILPRIGCANDKTFDEEYERFKITKTYSYRNPLKHMNSQTIEKLNKIYEIDN